jgi:hypothetical protein
MNQVAQTSKLGAQVAMTSGDGGFAVTPQTLNDIVEFAKFMSLSSAGIPSYLRGNAPDCAAITMQALKWGFDPFSVAQKSYKVKDVLAYEAQLIAAVINARSGIKGRLKYQFDGEGDNLTCTVSGTLDDEVCQYTSPRVGNITTKNSPLWKTDPQQQLGYYSARSWARRHCPEVILGAYDRDEAEEFRGPDGARDITPKPSVMERLRANADSALQPPARERDDTSASDAHLQTDRVLTGEIMPDETFDPDTGELTEQPTSDAPSPALEDDSAAPSPSALSEPADDPAPFVGSPIQERELVILRRFAKGTLSLAANPKTTGDTMSKAVRRWFNMELASLSEPGMEIAKGIKRSVEALMKGEASYEPAVEFHAEMLGCEPADLMPEVRTDA